jgi:hypothetical protein
MKHPWKMTGLRLIAFGALSGLMGAGFAHSRELEVIHGEGVAVGVDGKRLLTSPAEGLWSVALDWEKDWPSGWRHIAPTQVEVVGDTTLLRGELKLPEGVLKFQDAYVGGAEGIHGLRRVEWHGEKPLEQVSLAIRFVAPAGGRSLVMPGLLYHGNPSGERSGMTPVWHGNPGETLLMEEHRFSMPFVSFEFEDGAGFQGVALHSVPSPVAMANQQDQWWTLGAVAGTDGVELTLLSGPPAMNGQKSVVKAHQGRHSPMLVPYPDAWIDLQPGAVMEKHFVLQAYPVQQQGSGFETPTLSSIQLHRPHVGMEVFPGFETIVREKYRYAQQRWLEGPGYAGYNQFETGKDFIVWGWVGQAAAPGYAMQWLAGRWGESSDRDKVQRSLDFLSDVEFYESGFYTWYNVAERKWQGRIWRPMPEFLSQGQGMLNMARAIGSGRKNGFDTRKWESFLRKASDFFADRLLADDWNPLSTDEAFFIAPLALAADLLDSPRYLEAAEKAAVYYAQRHLTMEEPYWGGTLDASCEDKEGAFAAFQGFLELYERTGKNNYLDWARHAGMVCLTYLQVWDIDMPAGRLRDHQFRSRGWTMVSVQNHHLDVYGVLIAPDIYRLGRHLENPVLQETAKLMFRSCGQLMDHRGSQGEQVQQTFFSQGREGIPGAPVAYRGDYVEDWTVFWITAHFLTAAAQFEEMGVVW